MTCKVDAILNDTTGCLMACAYKHSNCAIGVIVGTGTNASYMENLDMADMYEGTKPTTGRRGRGVIINTEWGAFGNTGSLEIIRTSYDHELDRHSLNQGKQVCTLTVITYIYVFRNHTSKCLLLQCAFQSLEEVFERVYLLFL